MNYIIKIWNNMIEKIDIDRLDILYEILLYIKNGYQMQEIYKMIIDDYKKNINEILKLTPGLSTGLYLPA